MKKSVTFIACAAVLLASCTNEALKERQAQQAALVPPSKSAPAPLAGESGAKTTLESGEIGNSAPSAGMPPAPPIIVRGTGNFSNPASPGATVSAEQGGDITLNFVDADIRDVIKGILGDILHATYVIDPNVKGNITIKTNTPLTKEEVLPTLEQVLASNGLGLILDHGRYNITLLQDIKQTPLVPGGQANGYGNQIVRLRHVTAGQMVKVLDQYGQPNAVKTVPSAPNLIVLSGTGPERTTLLDIIDVFDIDRFTGMSFGIFPVSATDPETIISELNKIFAAGGSEADLQGVLEFLPIDRLNAVMAISADPTRLDQIKNWVDRLDHSEPTDTPHLYVHYVQHGEARHIAEVLRNIFNASGDSAAANDSANAKHGQAGSDQASSTPDYNQPSNPTNSLPAPTPQQPEQSGAAPQQMPPPLSPPAGTDTASPEATGQPDKAKMRIIADDSNNAVFVIATPRDYRLVDAAIKHLDVTPLQVMIEATIAEVTLNNTLKYGVQWFFKQGNSTITLSDAATGAVAAAFPGFGYVFSSGDATVVVNALDKVTNVKVISSPQLMVLDNKTAKLQVGDEVPVATQTAVSVTTSDAPVVNSIEYKDTGVILTVTPRVNSSGTVGLEIEQEVSDVVETTSSTLNSPTIQQRKLKSSVTVQDGQTIALGGLIRDNQTNDKQGIPILGDIPLLGNLFKTTTNSGNRTELLVLLTPHVVRDPAEAREITDELRKRVQAVAPLNEKIQSSNDSGTN